MEPQDDPEARIRELERSLAARASELGVGNYRKGGAGAPLHLPPPGAVYPAAPPNARARFRPLWMVLALSTISLVVLAAGVAVFRASMSPRGGSLSSELDGRPSVIGGGGSIDSGPGDRPSTPGGESVTTPPPGAPISVSGVGGNRRIACNDSFVNVSGVSNTVTITGHCMSLTVSGVENLVTLETADTISASGFDNRITYLSGSPQIDNSGGSNLVQQAN